jgi:hypothetical protein
MYYASSYYVSKTTYSGRKMHSIGTTPQQLKRQSDKQVKKQRLLQPANVIHFYNRDPRK